MSTRDLDTLLSSLANGPAAPVYVVASDLVLGQPAAEQLARTLAERASCKPEIHRRPPKLVPLLNNLRTYSLFATAKVILAIDTAVLTNREAAADLVDDAEAALPLSSTSECPGGSPLSTTAASSARSPSAQPARPALRAAARSAARPF